MFILDKMIMKLILNECAKLGGAFMLGPTGGAAIYIGIILWSMIKAKEWSNRKPGEKQK